MDLCGGTLFFLSVLPLTFIRYYMQPMDLPNLFFFLAGCLMIIKKKDWWLVPLMIVAMLNRETAILLVFVFMFTRYDEMEVPEFLLKTGVLFAAGMGTYTGLRAVYHLKHYYADLYYLPYNLTTGYTYLYALALFGPFLYLAFSGWGKKPKFLRRALLMAPFFLVIHFTMTIMVEPRLWLPFSRSLSAPACGASCPGSEAERPGNGKEKLFSPVSRA